MNDTLLVEIYFKWKKATLSEKLKLLQMWESYNAKKQKRQEREIVKEKRPEFIDECAAAAFESFDPTKIKLYDTDLNVLRMLRAINHEGFHALQNDYLFNKSDLIVSGSADKDKFYKNADFWITIYIIFQTKAFQQFLVLILKWKKWHIKKPTTNF